MSVLAGPHVLWQRIVIRKLYLLSLDIKVLRRYSMLEKVLLCLCLFLHSVLHQLMVLVEIKTVLEHLVNQTYFLVGVLDLICLECFEVVEVRMSGHLR